MRSPDDYVNANQILKLANGEGKDSKAMLAELRMRSYVGMKAGNEKITGQYTLQARGYRARPSLG